MTSVMPELGMIVDAGAGTQAGLTIRARCEVLRAQMEIERSTFLSHWRELGNFITPRRPRFFVTDVNKGDRRNSNIIDSTATAAARTCSAGMMSNVTSPSRPWFRLTTPDADLNKVETVKEWLYEVNRRMEIAFVRSNLYNVLPIAYKDMSVFGTASFAMLEDDEQIFRFYPFMIGSYSLANDEKNRVRTFVRTFRLTVAQVVDRWGEIDPKTGKPNFMDGRDSSISFTVQNLWKRGTVAAWVDIVHVIRPNFAYDGEKIAAKYKRYEEIYYEIGAPNQPVDPANYGLLAHSGYDEFPVLCLRWEVGAEDVYATDCPGMMALGDIKELQLRAKRSAQALEKMINPPMTGPSTLRQAKASLLPGDITYLDTRDGQNNGFRPVHEINFGASFGPMEQAAQTIRERIMDAFFVKLFLMMSESNDRDKTATEINEWKEEKLLALGPMLGQLNQDGLDPLIDRAFNIMARKGLIPPAPPELQGQSLRVEYVSIAAQALKMVGVGLLDRAAGFVGQVAQYDPDVLDVIDGDEMVRDYFDAMGVPPKIIRAEDDVQALRQQRQKAQAAQQAAANAPGLAGAAKDLSQAQPDGQNMLARLVGRANAQKTIGATAQPPVS